MSLVSQTTGLFIQRPDIFGPRVYLEANGTLASDLLPFLTKFDYEDDENKQDQLHLTFANPGLRFKDDKRFKDGATFRVRFGYAADISDVKNAIITKAKPVFAQGMPTIEMASYGLTKVMSRTGTPQNYGPVASSDIAQIIAKRYNYDTDIEISKDSRAQHRSQPAGVTDIQYLMGLAHVLNWDCYMEGKTLHFHHKRLEAAATCSFTYYTDGNGTLMKFHPDINMNSPRGTGVVGASNHDGSSNRGGGRGSGTATSKLLLLNSDAESVIGMSIASPESDQKVIQAHGEAQAGRIDMAAVKATAEMVGTPTVRARTNIRIDGVDQQYSGNWRVVKSKHVIDAKNYITTAHLKRDVAKANTKDLNKNAGGGRGSGSGKNVVLLQADQGVVLGLSGG